MKSKNQGKISVAIVGYEHAGKAMHKIFKDAVIYDKYLKIRSIEEVNQCGISFVCVPAPMLPSGHCDACQL